MNNSPKTLMLSIKPKFAARIFSGEKTIELRKVLPKVKHGDLVIVYVSSPVKAILGYFIVDGLKSINPLTFWNLHKSELGISFAEYQAYFSDREVAHGILISDAKSLEIPIPLNSLRDIMPGFHPPQLYRYFSPDEVAQLSTEIVH